MDHRICFSFMAMLFKHWPRLDLFLFTIMCWIRNPSSYDNMGLSWQLGAKIAASNLRRYALLRSQINMCAHNLHDSELCPNSTCRKLNWHCSHISMNLFCVAPDKKLDTRLHCDLFLLRSQNWWCDCMFDTSLTMVSARIAPIFVPHRQTSPLYFRCFPAANSFIFGTRAGRSAERRFISQRDNDFILQSISLCWVLRRARERIGWRRRPSSRFCMDCAPVIYSGTISARPRLRISRLHSPQMVLPGDNSHSRRGMRLECAQRGECVSGVITSSLDGVNGARNAAAGSSARPPAAS